MSAPNIVLIMADDMGYGDVGCFNCKSKIPTPNMDSIAAEGIKFTDFHSSSAICTPSRYGLLTGRYCWRSKLKSRVIFGYEPPLIEEGRITIADMLKNQGYSTACIGKWHLGIGFSVKEGEYLDFDRAMPWPEATKEQEKKIDFSKPLTGGPTERGFDYFFGTAGCPTAQPPYGYIENTQFVDLPSIYFDTPVYTGRPGMMAESYDFKDVDLVFAKKAENYIKEQQEKEEPFFLYLPLSSPHEPCIEEYVPEIARGKSEAGPRGDMVWLFDKIVGDIKETLKKTGQWDNTLFIVTSDNGALPGDRIINENGEEEFYTYEHSSCGDWRGYKAHIWDGGHREPFMARWPGKIKVASECDEICCMTDLFSTLGIISGSDILNGSGEDSFNILPYLTGQSGKRKIRSSIVHHSGFGVFSIRSGDWKAIFETQGSGGWPPPYGDGPVFGAKGQLYNISEDPQEKNNLWDNNPEKVYELSNLLMKYKNEGRSNYPARKEKDEPSYN